MVAQFPCRNTGAKFSPPGTQRCTRFAFFADFAVFSSYLWAEEVVYAKEECVLKMQTCASCRVGTYHL